MNARTLEATLKVHFKVMRERLDQVAPIARAVDVDSLGKAVEIATMSNS
jgi:hypothetical protein